MRIVISQAYSPLGSPGSWVKGEILKEPILLETAEKLNKSPAQVALRWGVQSGHSILPKSVSESRIKENLSLFDWCIPQELFSKFSGIYQVKFFAHYLELYFFFFNQELSTNILRLDICAAKATPRRFCNTREIESL